MNEMNFYTLNGEQYEVADKANREAVKRANQDIAKKADLDYLNRNFAPAIPVTMSGTAVSTDMVSPVEHQVRCKISDNNLISISGSGKISQNGVEITNNKDGSFILNTPNGPCTDIVEYKMYYSPNVILLPGFYTSSGIPSGYNQNIKIDYNYKHATYGEPVTFELLSEERIDLIRIVVYSGVELNNVIVRPRLERGKIATQYIPDLTAVTVTRCGKNLLSKWIPQMVPAGPNGELESREYLCGCSDMISVNPDYVYTFSNNWTDKNKYIMGYDINKNKTGSSAFGINTTPALFEEYPNTRYIRCIQTYAPNKGPQQLEVGNAATAYEPYFTETFTPDSDGNVKGMTSVSPSMTIFANNPNVTIEATYNADTKKYIDKKFAELQAAIVSTGGNV